MKFEREDDDKAKCAFEVLDKPTVRQQLAYLGAVSSGEAGDFLIRFWNGAKEVITSWECEILPDYKKSIDELTDPKQADVIIWAGLRVREYMDTLDEIPKN